MEIIKNIDKVEDVHLILGHPAMQILACVD